MGCPRLGCPLPSDPRLQQVLRAMTCRPKADAAGVSILPKLEKDRASCRPYLTRARASTIAGVRSMISSGALAASATSCSRSARNAT
jgi:hypothetical protein